MKNQHLKKIGLFAVCVALSGGLVSAVWAGHRHHDRHEQSAHYIAEELSLNDEQEEKLEVMLETMEKKRKQLRDEAKEQMHAIVTQDKISKEDALKILQSRKAKKETMRDYIATQLVGFHAILTPAQREELAESAPRMLKLLQGKKRHGKKRHGKKHHGKKHREHDCHEDSHDDKYDDDDGHDKDCRD